MYFFLDPFSAGELWFTSRIESNQNVEGGWEIFPGEKKKKKKEMETQKAFSLMEKCSPRFFGNI